MKIFQNIQSTMQMKSTATVKIITESSYVSFNILIYKLSSFNL